MSEPTLLLVDYSPLSVVIYTGKNNEYDEKLKEMGGKKGTNFAKYDNDHFDIGFVFSKKMYEKNQEEFDDFIDAVNNGTYSEKTVKKAPIKIDKEKLLSATKPAMSADDIAKKLAANKIPKLSSISTKKEAEAEVTVRDKLESTDVVLNFPNKFVGSDNNEYQIIVHTVMIPKVGQKCKIDKDDCIVKNVDLGNGILKLESEDGEFSQKAFLINGKWVHYNEKGEFTQATFF
jgi:hypothetical protein